MKRKIDFILTLIPLGPSGAYNFRLQAVGNGWAPGYYSPLASYIDGSRAIMKAREHASRIALSAGARIGRFRITEDPAEDANSVGQVGPVGRVGQSQGPK